MSPYLCHRPPPERSEDPERTDERPQIGLAPQGVVGPPSPAGREQMVGRDRRRWLRLPRPQQLQLKIPAVADEGQIDGVETGLEGHDRRLSGRSVGAVVDLQSPTE